MTTQAEVGVGFDVSALLKMSASVDSLAAELQRTRQRTNQVAQSVHPFSIPPMPMPITSSAGTLNIPNILGPQTGNYWDVHRISVTGFSAGTVSVYLGQNGAELLAVFSTAGVLLNGKAQILLNGNDAMYFAGTSITAATGYVTVSVAGVEIAASCIGDYLL
jgi:hypothetical protein